jgi:hypothetical protein
MNISMMDVAVIALYLLGITAFGIWATDATRVRNNTFWPATL